VQDAIAPAVRIPAAVAIALRRSSCSLEFWVVECEDRHVRVELLVELVGRALVDDEGVNANDEAINNNWMRVANLMGDMLMQTVVLGYQ